MFNPSLSDSALDQAIKEYEALLSKYKGKIIDMDKKGKNRLAYEIKDMKEAHHVLLNIEADPTSIVAIKKQVEITDNILRMLILNSALNKKVK